MTSTDFSTFVTAENTAAKDASDSRARRIDEWRRNVDDLYSQVQDFLEDFVKDGSIIMERQDRSMSEELLGNYKIDQLLIRIGATRVALEPVGAMIFGAFGRVDLIGPRDAKKFVLVPEASERARIRVLSAEEAEQEAKTPDQQPELAWKISEGPRKDYIRLERATLMDAIMAVAQ
jgi:hypothetical protein